MGNKMGKRLLLAGVPGILAQPLAQVFQRERWTVASLGPCGAAGVVSYDCGVMDAAARDVLAVHHIDVLVYGLLGQEEPVAALARLLTLARVAGVGRVLLLSGAEAVQPQAEASSADGARTEKSCLLACLEAYALRWKQAAGVRLTVVRLPELYGHHLALGEGVLGICLTALSGERKRLPRLETRGTRYFLSARDAAFGLLRLVERDFAGDVMEFAEPQGVTFPMFAASLRAVLPQSEQRTLAEVLTRLQAGDEQVLPYALPELSAAAAEDAAMEAADAQQEAAQAEAEAAQAAAEAAQQEKEEAAAEDDVREAEDWAREAAADLVSAQAWEREAAEQVAHFGEGEGGQAGFEYYSWRGRRAGHQLYLPLSYFSSHRQDGHMVDFSLSAGRVASASGYAGGHVSGFTDTVLGITLHGDHPRDSVRYHFTLNVPTGESRVYQSAVLPEGVAAMTSFGAGWEYIPAVEWLHHFTERDSLDATLSCAWRAAYDYARESPSAVVHPGTQLAEEVSYQHIGERQQTRIGLRHSSTAMARQDTFDYDGWLQGGMEGTVPVSGETRYHEGETWGLRWLSNRKIAPRDEYFHCLAFEFTNAVHGYDAGKVYEQFASVGVRHTVTPQLHWQAVASYQHVSAGSSDIERRLLTRGEEVGDDLMNGGWSRFGLLARLTWQPRPEEQLTFSLERYVRRDEASVGYHGWGMALWYSRSL